MLARHSPQLAHRPLKTGNERLERLGEAHHPRLPSRVRQNEVIQQMIEWLAPDGDPQIVHRGEVALSVLARPWLLWEHHLLVRSVLGAPPADFPLQRAQLPF